MGNSPAGMARVASGERWIPYPHLLVLNQHLRKVASGEIKRLIVEMPPQHGKALSNDTPILTLQGWKTHGDLCAGDFVFSPEGNPIKVIASTNVFFDDTYEITFSDGNKIVAGAHHEWKVSIDKSSGRLPEQIVETKDLFSIKQRRKPRICLSSPPQFTDANLPIDPYLLGVWLGDGMSNMGYIAAGPEDWKHFSSLGEATEERPRYWRILIRGLRTNLRKINLLKNKHIPGIYFIGSYSQRLSLLQGLMDTDGYCATHGQCEFTSVKINLANDVRKLIESLGMKVTLNEGRATIRGRYIGQKYRLLFTPKKETQIFRLERKQKRLDGLLNSCARYRYIKNIKQVSRCPLKCIQVEGGMYCAGTAMIPTHNRE